MTLLLNDTQTVAGVMTSQHTVATHSRYGKIFSNKLCGICHSPRPCKLTFDLESGVRVTCDVSTSVPILVFLGLSALDLGPMYAIDRQTSDVSLSLCLCLSVSVCLSLSLRFNGHFPGEPGLASFTEAKDDGGGGGDN